MKSLEDKYYRISNVIPRFLSNINFPETPDGCWEWTARKNKDGYGRMKIRSGKRGAFDVSAHRISYEIYYGAIPEGLVVRHFICNNPGCVNPQHLKLGTCQENSDDMVNFGRSPKGEEKFSAKLTELDVLNIRKKYFDDHISSIKLGIEYGVNHITIIDVIHGRSWKHVGGQITDKNLKNKLSDEQVIDLREKFGGGCKVKDLALEFDLSIRNIYRVANGEYYKNIK